MYGYSYQYGRIIGKGGNPAAAIFGTYKSRVLADSGVVENDACTITFLESIGAGTDIIPSFSFLLDDYSGAAAAYSLRQLSSSYSGDAIRVRRSSDNSELNIGFVANELDTSALTTFASGTDAFVTTWYDQSGSGYNAVQTTASNQPKVVSSGSVLTLNSKPCVSPNGTSDNLTFTTISSTTHYISVVGGETTKGRFLAASNAYSSFIGSGIGTLNAIRIGTVYNLSSRILQNQDLITWTRVTTDSNVYQNSVLNTNNTVSTSALSLGQLFQNTNDATTSSDGKFQEIIIYTSNQNANRSGIEANTNTYYGIY